MNRLLPRQKAPNIHFPLANGDEWRLQDRTPEAFTLVVVFRHLNCGYCKRQVQSLDQHAPLFADLGVDIVAVSAETQANAHALINEWDIRNIDIGYALPFETGEALGLYVSSKRKDGEPEQFFEPGMFMFKPNGELYYAAVQNMPFGRPALEDMLEWVPKVLANNVPARGERALAFA